MKTHIRTASYLLTALIGVGSCRAAADLNDWADKAVSPDQAVAQAAQHQLREAGPQGLQALEHRFATEIRLHRSGAPSNEAWKRVALALDRVGGQYDNYASGLYWYTDMEKAKAAARASGKPILSLRLLGRLDEDLSCANSRFFRTTLYPRAEINQLLKQRFILHWQSVRPAPKVTIEFGDGRKLQRTITGNSIHYILDEDGHVMDALPGLYSAPAFVAELHLAVNDTEQGRSSGNHDYTAHLETTRNRLLRAWAADLGALHVNSTAAQPLTETALASRMNENLWQQIAQVHANRAATDSAVRELMTRKLPAAPLPALQLDASKAGFLGAAQPAAQAAPSAMTAVPIAVSKQAVEIRMLTAFDTFDQTTALDTVKNNYMLRTRILTFLAGSGTRSWTLDRVNDWVYAQIFLTPRQDPWLGLAPKDVFSAIDGNGELR